MGLAPLLASLLADVHLTKNMTRTVSAALWSGAWDSCKRAAFDAVRVAVAKRGGGALGGPPPDGTGARGK